MRHATTLIFISCCIIAVLWAAQAPVERIRASGLAGEVVAWGNNTDATNIPAGLTDVIGIAGGSNFAIALKKNGSVVGWGDNSYGQLNSLVGLSNVIEVTAGSANALALKSDGNLVAWGDNSWGRATVPTGLSDVTAIAAGTYHCLAIKEDGTVSAWGDNTFFQAVVPTGLTDVIAIAGGQWHSLALKSDGSVVAWGRNTENQASVPPGLTDVIAIAAGGLNSIALKHDGTVVVWGSNESGQTDVPFGLTAVTAIAAGQSHLLALKSDGTVTAWGADWVGQAAVPVGLSGVVKITAAPYHNFAITSPDFVTMTPSPTLTPSITLSPTKSNTRTRTLTRSKTRTFTKTPSVPSKTPTRTFTRTLTTTIVAKPISVVQSERGGAPYRGQSSIDSNSYTGTLYAKITNNTNEMLYDVYATIDQSGNLCFFSGVTVIPAGEFIVIPIFPYASYPYCYYPSYSNKPTKQSVLLHYNYLRYGSTKTLRFPIEFYVDYGYFLSPTVTQTPTRTPTPHPPVLRNPLFESGRGNWTASATSNAAIIQRIPAIAHSGDWLAIFGNANRETATLSQAFYALPTQDTLTFWYKLTSSERCGFSYDTVRVLVGGVVRWELDACTFQASTRWQQASVPIPRGRNTSVTFEMRTNPTNPSTWFVDDVEVR